MVTRRLAHLTTSDDDDDDDDEKLEEEEEAGPPKPSSSSDDDPMAANNNNSQQQPRRRPTRQKRRRVAFNDDDEEEEEEEEEEEKKEKEKENGKGKGKPQRGKKQNNNNNSNNGSNGRKRSKVVDDDDEEEEEEEGEEEEEQVQEDAKPIGEVIRVSGKGRFQRKHFNEFEFDGNRFELEDPVLLTPEDKKQKPYVAIIKDITQTKDDSMMVTGQWFYRPEEAEKKGGGSWQARDTRELFYSFHRDEVPAESVMHKCVVHFVPLHKQLPSRKEHPGFIVQKVYDTVERKLWKLTDKDYEDGKQEEIDVLVQKTMSRLGDLPDIETDDAPAPHLDDLIRSKRLLRKRQVSPIDVSREDEGMTRSDQKPRAETPGSCIDKTSKHYLILAEANALTKETLRDRWLDKLLQSIELVFAKTGSVTGENEGAVEGLAGLTWPDSAVSAVVALEKACHEAFSSDFAKYNSKMRQLDYNVKGTELLARRLLNGELEPSKILNMSPTELKEGLTEEEIARNQPEEPATMQMTDARCKRCSEKKVGVVDIIQAGHGDRYQLECIACGNSWYASRDEAAMMSIEASSVVTSVGTAPWATSKFENVEKKKLLSPRDSERANAVKKYVEASAPVLETQRSFKSKTEDTTVKKLD